MSQTKKWLEEFQEKVANCWEWHSPALQIGFSYVKPYQGDDFGRFGPILLFKKSLAAKKTAKRSGLVRLQL